MKVIASLLFATSFLLLGCRPEVDYSPSTSSSSPADATAQQNSGAGSSTESGILPETFPEENLPVMIAYDEFDGVHSHGWAEEGLGGWADAGEIIDGALVVSGNVNLARAIAKPARTSVVWYAVTMRMETSVSGYASVVPSPDGIQPFSNLGFSAETTPFTSRGFWMITGKDTRIENTETQTFLTRYNFEVRSVKGYAGRDDGKAIVDESGIVFVKPRFRSDRDFSAAQLSHLLIRKKGPEKLIIERISIARTPEAALDLVLGDNSGSDTTPEASGDAAGSESGETQSP